MARQIEGGFTARFVVERTDGKPIDPARRYLVLDYAGSDPHAITAIHAYADSIENENAAMARDLRAALKNPADWPAQHRNADALPLPKPLTPEDFAAACRDLVRHHAGHELHLLLDELVTGLLRDLGYGEGMRVFLAHAMPYHREDGA